MGQSGDQTKLDRLPLGELSDLLPARDGEALQTGTRPIHVPVGIKWRQKTAQLQRRHPSIHHLVFGEVPDLAPQGYRLARWIQPGHLHDARIGGD